MKYIPALFAVLAIIGLGQAHQLPDFGSGPLHEDVQDLLDLIPVNEIKNIAVDYIAEDSEVQEAVNYLLTSTVLKDLTVDLEAIPEVINLINYIQKEGVDIYSLINQVNRALGIEKLVPPPSHFYSPIIQRTGGIKGLFEDIKKLIRIDKFIRTYVQKIKTSSAFANFINQLKSDNFQKVVNKVYQIKSFQIIINGLKTSGVNTQIVADIIYIVLGITVPNDVTVYQERTLGDELMDFVRLIPEKEVNDIVMKYVKEDEKVKKAVQYLLTPEFHSILRDVEALEEHRALVVYLEKAGLHVINAIKILHKTINMEDYVPPKIESTFQSEIGIQEIGDGMEGMLKDIYNVLPIDKIKALYKEKLQNSKIFADFIEKLKSPEMQKLINDIYANQTYKNFVTTIRGKGWDLQELIKLITTVLGLKFPN